MTISSRCFRASLLFTVLLAPVTLWGVGELRLEQIADGFGQPIWVGQAPGDPAHLFVAEQASGRLQVVELATGTVRETPFLEIDDLSTGGERGFLGVAFAPDYEQSGAVFVNFTDSNGDTVVRRYFRSVDDPLQVDPDSALDLLNVKQPFSNHNAGWIEFGPDGYLYVALGDGGSGFDPNDDAQNTETLLGSILRLEVPTLADASTYTIPADNPFSDGGGAPEIWHYGLRNPWRNSFDRQTGELWIADVGQNAMEEVNVVPSDAGGLNFGWKVMEGTLATGQNSMGPPANDPSFVEPIFTYEHDQGRSITGGYVYRGLALGPAWEGRYFFGDFAFNKIWSFRPADGEATDVQEHTATLANAGAFFSGVSTFGQGLDGELYVGSYNNGRIFRLTAESLLHFGDPMTFADGWKSLSWFGNYNDQFFPFIYHDALGAFLYCDGPGASEDSFFFWSEDLGWFWTNADLFPLVYRWDIADWETILEA